MMVLNQLGTIIALNLLGVISPGPDSFLIARIATRSRLHAFATVCGICTGLVVWVSLTVGGAAAVLTAYPVVLGAIQFVGGLWLMWMGRSMLLSAWKQFREKTHLQPNYAPTMGSLRQCYTQGLLTNLSNPKAVLYFSAIIAPFMPAQPTVMLALGIVVLIVGSAALVFSLFVVLLSAEAMRVRFVKAGPVIDAVAGLFFVVAGASLVIHGGMDLWARF